MKKLFQRNSLQNVIFCVARCLEMFLSAFLAIVIMILAARMVMDLFKFDYLLNSSDALSYFLETAMNLAVGVELIKMLCIHTPETVVEVLLFAIARQIIVSHSSIAGTIIGVLCIAILFATRKFLFRDTDQKEK